MVMAPLRSKGTSTTSGVSGAAHTRSVEQIR